VSSESEIADHPFEPWPYPSTGKVICIHLEGGRICDRPEQEHAPANEEAGA
jgi:hypothetical protein